MKNAGNRNEIPGPGAKEMPSAPGPSNNPKETEEKPSGAAQPSRQELPAPTVVTQDSSPNQHAESVSSAETSSPHAARVATLTQMISEEVRVFRQAKSDGLEVVLKPDHHTEIALEFRIHQGQLEACARCQQGDFHALHAEWPQLQQALSQQGVRLLDLNPSSLLGNSTGNASHRQSEDQARRETPMPSESLDELPLVGSMTEPQKTKTPRRHPGRPAKGFFDSWA